MLAGLFWDTVDSFAGLFDGFYYMFTGERTSKADKFDNLCFMKILNTPLTQKSPGIHTKRPKQEQHLGAVDSFAGLFDRFYYIFTGESTSKADKFDNLRSMKILNTPLTQKSPGIHTKRPKQEQNLQTKKGALSRPCTMNSGNLVVKNWGKLEQ